MANIGAFFDHRFGHLHLKTDGPGVWTVVLSDLLRDFGITAEELRAHLEVAAQPRETRDLETICREAIAGLKLKGKTVLDVGGYDGRMAAYALERGAKRAICLDNRQWERYGWTEKDKLPGVEYITGDVMAFGLAEDGIYRCYYGPDASPVGGSLIETYPRPDVILLFNVLYHTENPWAFLDRCREILKPGGVMLLCSLVRFDDQPRWYLYEPHECNPDDDTVYWGPSKTGLIRLLTLTGWKVTEVGQAVERLVLRCKPCSTQR